MADPILANGVRVQAIFQGVSGLPEDRFVNTWAFVKQAAPATVDDVEDAIERVRRFYTVQHPPLSGNSVDEFLTSEVIDPSTSELRGYRMGQAPPREPIIEPFGPTLSPPGSNALPNEVAVCMSFYASRNLPGQRGRVYIGPLGINATTQSGPARPTPALQNVLRLAAEALMEDETNGLRWAVLGDRDGTGRILQLVEGGWIDDAFDTQRRRGVAPTGRVQFERA